MNERSICYQAGRVTPYKPCEEVVDFSVGLKMLPKGAIEKRTRFKEYLSIIVLYV
jgi:hypothetical protein